MQPIVFTACTEIWAPSTGVTAMHWVPLMVSVTYRLGSVNVSQASLVSVVRDVRSTTLDLDQKAANVSSAGMELG